MSPPSEKLFLSLSNLKNPGFSFPSVAFSQENGDEKSLSLKQIWHKENEIILQFTDKLRYICIKIFPNKALSPLYKIYSLVQLLEALRGCVMVVHIVTNLLFNCRKKISYFLLKHSTCFFLKQVFWTLKTPILLVLYYIEYKKKLEDEKAF